jgi:TonB-dependent starch-binding outer membrane protein SusC
MPKPGIQSKTRIIMCFTINSKSKTKIMRLKCKMFKLKVFTFGLILGLGISGQISAQQRNVQGTLTDNEGSPLPGVTVVVKGTTQGTVTNADGNYTITGISDDATLVFSFVGMRTQEIEVGNQTTINVEMVVDEIGIEEVVAIGYGTVKKSDLTGAVASVNAEDLQVGTINSLDKQLSGRVAGVQVTQLSGQPGSGTAIRIRGTNSILGNNDPLYVIDGVPYGNSIHADINPNDIKSVEILKDASSTAIYGSRGANGVILITTKSGSKGKPKIDFDSYYALSSLVKKLDLLNAEEIAEVHRMAIENGVAQSYDPTSITGPGTDWQDELYRTAKSKNFQLSVMGGNEELTYMFSGNYLNEQGIVLNSDYKRYGLRTNVNSRINDKLRVGINLYFAKSETNPGSNFKDALWANPIYPVKDESGNYSIYTDPNSQVVNPVATNLLYLRNNNRNTVLSNLFAEYEIVKGLVARSNYGVNIFDAKNNSFAPRTIAAGITNNSVASINNQNHFFWVSTNTLTYDKNINENNSLQGMVGFTAEKTRTENAAINSNNFVTDYQLYHSVESAENQSASSSLFENQLASFIGRLNYNLMEKYLFTFSGRYDGSSKFGNENKWAFFPSGAFAWKISNEEFMRRTESTISDLKLRISAGSSGEQAIGSYQTLPSLAQTAALFAGSTYRIGFFPNRLPNPNLKWEKTNQYDIGIDAGFFNSRIIFTADFYYKKTMDLLYHKAIPESTGYSGVISNIGSIENRGMEYNISSHNTTGKFKWTTDFNISFNRNKILDLGEHPDGTKIERILSPVGSREIASLPDINALIVGKPIGGAYGYVYDGTYKSIEEVNNGFEPDKIPGDPRYKNLNEDQIINSEDRKLISNPNPDFFGGLSNKFTYANFDLSVFLQFVVGNELYNFDHYDASYLEGIRNNFSWALDAWSPENPNSDIPRAGWALRVNGVNTFHVEDGSYLRGKNVTFGYTLPGNLSNIQTLRLYCSIDNLFTLTKYSGYNPDVNSGGRSAIVSGFDEAQYPLAKTVLFGLKIEF